VAKRLVFMEAGEIIEVGPPRDLLNSPQSNRLREFVSRIHNGFRVNWRHP
jgi:ABC-type histidine transport system ATPase subunit